MTRIGRGEWVGMVRAPDLRTRDELHAKCEADVAAFLARGGVIETIPQGASGISIAPTGKGRGHPIRIMGRDKLRKVMSKDRERTKQRKLWRAGAS